MKRLPSLLFILALLGNFELPYISVLLRKSVPGGTTAAMSQQ